MALITTDSTFNATLETARGLNRNTRIYADDLTTALLEVGQEIINYCNINQVPLELRFTWARMGLELADYYFAKNSLLDESAEDDGELSLSALSSLKVGDTSIGLGNVPAGGADLYKKRALAAHKPDLDEIIFNYQAQLNKFRKMVW